MTKLLITENLITNKQDFIKLSNISEGVEFITFDEFLSTTTLSLFEDSSKKFVFDKFVNFRDLSKSDYDFSLDYIFQIKKSSLSKFSEVSSNIEIIESLKKGKDKFFPWDLSNIIFNQKESLSNEIIYEFCQNEYLFQQFLSYLNKELLRINLLFDNEEESVSLLLDEKTDFKYELANRRLSNISRDNLNQSFHQLNKIERLINESEFNHENNKRFVVGIKKLLEF
jgi:hypothetical protein